MVDFYKMRGYPPIYSLDYMLLKKSAGWANKRTVPVIKSEVREFTKRVARPRATGKRFEQKKLKIGDIVYSVVSDSYSNEQYGSVTGKGRKYIQPYVVDEIDDCYVWARKSVHEKRKDYMTYVWVTPLTKINGKWMISKYPKNRKRKCAGRGHAISVNDPWDGVFMTPEEAMWNELRG